MRCFVGKVKDFKATVGITAPSTCRTKMMVCLIDVSTSSGSFRDHHWVERTKGFPKKGTKIQFSSRVRKCFSHFEGLNQIDRIGLSVIKRLEVVA